MIGNKKHILNDENLLEKSIVFQDLHTLNKKVLCYWEGGENHKNVLLFIHGLGGRASNWVHQLKSLVNYYHVIAFDLPGYGKSSFPDCIDDKILHYFSEVITSFCSDKLNKKVTLIGHSMGGQIVMLIASKNPIWWQNLILLSPAGLEKFRDEEKQILSELYSSDFFFTQSDEQIRSSFRINFFNETNLIEHFIEERLQQKNETTYYKYCKVKASALRSMLNKEMEIKFKEIKAPTTLVFGNQDQLIPNRQFHDTMTLKKVMKECTKIDKLKTELIDDAGHMIQLDQPKIINSLIMGSVAESDQSS